MLYHGVIIGLALFMAYVSYRDLKRGFNIVSFSSAGVWIIIIILNIFILRGILKDKRKLKDIHLK